MQISLFCDSKPEAVIEDLEHQIREVIKFHIEGRREDGAKIPLPSSRVIMYTSLHN